MSRVAQQPRRPHLACRIGSLPDSEGPKIAGVRTKGCDGAEDGGIRMASSVRSAVAIACALLIAGCNQPVPTTAGGTSPTPTQSAYASETAPLVSETPAATPTSPPTSTPTSAASPPSPMPAPTLAAPVLISPPDGTVFGKFPRITTCQWSAVVGAIKYQFQAEFWELNQKQWVKRYSADVPATTYTFDFVGKQPGRWRVAGVDGGGHVGPFSGWWGFVYTV